MFSSEFLFKVCITFQLLLLEKFQEASWPAGINACRFCSPMKSGIMHDSISVIQIDLTLFVPIIMTRLLCGHLQCRHHIYLFIYLLAEGRLFLSFFFTFPSPNPLTQLYSPVAGMVSWTEEWHAFLLFNWLLKLKKKETQPIKMYYRMLSKLINS